MKLFKIVLLTLCIALVFFCNYSCKSPHDDNVDPKDSCTNDTCRVDTTSIKCTDNSEAVTIANTYKSYLSKITLPPGFKIDIFADKLADVRQLAVSPSGVVYAGTNGNFVYALQDVDGDYIAEKQWTISTGLNKAAGVAFKDGDLFVGAVTKIVKYTKIENCLSTIGTPVLITDIPLGEPDHILKYLSFSPDGKLYVPIGAPCDACEPTGNFGTIIRMNADGTNQEVYARGVRNPVGVAFHPVSGELWFTDPGRDEQGPDNPSCELNNAPNINMNFGFPYCHAGYSDPVFGSKFPCSDFTDAAEKFGAHTTPLGLKFYTGDMFPAKYKNQLFVALKGTYWGPSNGGPALRGHNITLVKMDTNNKSIGFETFASGWLTDANAASSDQGSWGRPVDVLMLKDGSILVSDDKASVIYRISYNGL